VPELTFGIGPRWSEFAGSAQAIGRLAARIEVLGFDAIFVGDHLSFHSPYLDPFVVLSIAAAHTSRLRLQTSVLILPLYQPFRLANAAATLDAASGGRLILGVGVGGEGPKDFAAVEVPIAERGRRADEILQILRRLWTEEGEVTFAGKFYRLDGVRLQPQARAADRAVEVLEQARGDRDCGESVGVIVRKGELDGRAPSATFPDRAQCQRRSIRRP